MWYCLRCCWFFTSTTYDPIFASFISSHHDQLVAEKGLWRAVTAVDECSKIKSGPCRELAAPNRFEQHPKTLLLRGSIMLDVHMLTHLKVLSNWIQKLVLIDNSRLLWRLEVHPLCLFHKWRFPGEANKLNWETCCGLRCQYNRHSTYLFVRGIGVHFYKFT